MRNHSTTANAPSPGPVRPDRQAGRGGRTWIPQPLFRAGYAVPTSQSRKTLGNKNAPLPTRLKHIHHSCCAISSKIVPDVNVIDEFPICNLLWISMFRRIGWQSSHETLACQRFLLLQTLVRNNKRRCPICHLQVMTKFALNLRRIRAFHFQDSQATIP